MAELEVIVFDKSHERSRHTFVGAFEVGRQRSASEILYARLPEGSRLTVAEFSDNSVSRQHALIEPLESKWVRIKNLSHVLPIHFEEPPGSLLLIGETREVELPQRIRLGSSSFLKLGSEPFARQEDGSLSRPVWINPESKRYFASKNDGEDQIKQGCQLLRKDLEQNNLDIALPTPLYEALRLALLDMQSGGRLALAENFYRVVVLDLAPGIGENGLFDAKAFFRDVVKRLVEVFNLDLAEETGPDDVFQILKDEPRSLLCLLNGQLAGDAGMLRLRAFTQAQHSVLLLSCIPPTIE
jgi:hypothetical protein